MTLQLRAMSARTVTEVRLRSNSRNEDPTTINCSATNSSANMNKVCHAGGNMIQSLDSPSQPNHLDSKPFSCFIKSNKETRHFWKAPVKFFHIAARELSVLLILIETLILLGGYLMILGVHHSIRYCLSRLRKKAFANDNVSYNNNNNYVRNYYQHARPVIPRRVPRGRMAGG